MKTDLLRRRGALGVAGLSLMVMTLGVACVPETPATPGTTTAAPATTTTTPNPNITLTNAKLSWSINRYAQYGIFGAWSFVPQTSNVTVTQQLGSTITPLETNASKQYNVINFSGGTGTINATTGAGTITWNNADVVVNAYPPMYAAPNETFSDPVLTINANGSGTLSVLFSAPAHNDMGGEPVPAVVEQRAVIANFDNLAQLTGSSLKVNPKFAGQQYVVGGVAQGVPTCPAPEIGGAFPQQFVNLVPESVKAHYYTTGCGPQQSQKAPTPFTVTFG